MGRTIIPLCLKMQLTFIATYFPINAKNILINQLLGTCPVFITPNLLCSVTFKLRIILQKVIIRILFEYHYLIEIF